MLIEDDQQYYKHGGMEITDSRGDRPDASKINALTFCVKKRYLKEMSKMDRLDVQPVPSLLQQANRAFREKRLETALALYEKARKEKPELNPIIEKNIELLIRKGFKPESTSANSLKPIFKSKQASYKSFTDAFDSEFYFYTYPDIKKAGVNPEDHYRNWGWKEYRRPNNWFDPEFYLNQYKEVKQSSIEPLTHFLEQGIRKGYRTKRFELPKLSEEQLHSIPKIKFDSIEEKYYEYKKNEYDELAVKVIAFYLPQFHPFPENDAWWGKGFTEWTNVSKAAPNYYGHYQPHLPIHNGFYDLRIPEVMIEQAKLAKNYGIYGFNFYYYWFDGKILMHKPFEILLKHKEIDIPFCITWANENWTRRWDGAENDILIGQNHCEEDSIKFIENLYQFFDDERYIKINNKPLLIIYRANIIPDMKETILLWRNKAKDSGYDGLYIVCAQTFGLKSPEKYGFDAAMEFPPHTVKSNEISKTKNLINKNYEGRIYDYEQVVNHAVKSTEPDFKLFRTCMLSWDNTARKQNNSHTFTNFSLLRYKQWILNLAVNVYGNNKYTKEEKIVFVNAWNEWAEGTHLEPDRKFGYGYLQSTFDSIKHCKQNNIDLLSKPFFRSKELAVILHIHYTDVWDDIHNYLKNLNSFGFDLYVTLTNVENNIIEKIFSCYPSAVVRLVENRGRDILPFIKLYREIKGFNYKAICKIHSKKSAYRSDGAKIRDELYDGLLGSKETIQLILDNLNKPENLGLYCPDKYMIPHTDHNMTYDKAIVDEVCGLLEINFEYSKFPAGSMYWFNPNAFSGIEKIKDEYFDVEDGFADGTLAHGFERVVNMVSKSNGFKE